MNKFNKGKTLGVAIAALSSLSLVGVGFAAWVVYGTEGKDTGNITVTVANVKDERMIISEAGVTSNNSINFDASGEGTFLKAETGSNEDRTFEITFKLVVKKDADFTKFTGIKAYVKGGGLISAVNKGYVTLPAGVYSDETSMKNGSEFAVAAAEFKNENKSTEEGITTYTMQKELTMGWGSAFGNVNPTQSATASNLDLYVTQLNELKKLSLNFTLFLMPFVSA